MLVVYVFFENFEEDVFFRKEKNDEAEEKFGNGGSWVRCVGCK